MSENKTITLPSGNTAVVRPGKGRDLLNAQRAANGEEEVMFGLIASLVAIGGRPLVLEDVMELPLADLLALQTYLTEAVLGKKALPAPSTSSSSPTTRAGASPNSVLLN